MSARKCACDKLCKSFYAKYFYSDYKNYNVIQSRSYFAKCGPVLAIRPPHCATCGHRECVNDDFSVSCLIRSVCVFSSSDDTDDSLRALSQLFLTCKSCTG